MIYKIYNIKQKIDNVQSLIPNYDLSIYQTTISASNKISSDNIQMTGNQTLSQYKDGISSTIGEINNNLNFKQFTTVH